MNRRDQEIRRQIHTAIDGGLSHLEVNPSLYDTILRQSKGEKRMKRRLSASFVLSAVLLLAMAALGAAATRFGVLEFKRHQTENETYITHILSVDEIYENEYMTLALNDVVFDGTYLDVTIDVQPKPGCGEGVYVYPSMTAVCGGRVLEADVDACYGDFFTGFWVPERDKSLQNADGRYGVTYSVYAEDMKLEALTDEVTWTMSWDIIRPVFEIESIEMIFDGNETEETWDAYVQRFKQAYGDQKILLAEGYSLFEYVSALPTQPDISQEGRGLWKLPNRLTESGAFEWVDRVEFSFTTQESGIKTLSAPQTFDLGDYEVTVKKLSYSFGHCDYEMELIKKPGKGKTAGQEFVDDDPQWEFAVLADGCQTRKDRSSQGLKYGTLEEPSAEMLYQGTVILTGETDSVTFVPCWSGDSESWTFSEVYAAQRPGTPEQEALAFTIRIE